MGYSKQVYDRVWETMSRRRAEARDAMLRRREQIRARIPEIEKIEREMALQASRVGKLVITDPEHAAELVDALAKENLALQDRRAQLLTEHGFSEDDLVEQYHCEVCKDTGYDGPRRCECLQRLLRIEASAQLSAMTHAQSCRFDNFSLQYYPGNPVDPTSVVPRIRMGEILEYCQNYAANFSLRSPSLLLMGHTGLGKTHLSLAVADQVTRGGFGVIYTPVQKLMDTLEGEKFSRGSGSESYTDLTAHYLDCDLLVLDDLGTEFTNQFTGAALFNIINSRLTDGRPTIINTNLEISEIEQKYYQRMVSRLICGYKVLKFAGKDIRYIKKVEDARRR